MQQKAQNPIVIEKLYGGWAYDLSLSNATAVQGNDAEYSKSSAVALFRPGFDGHMAPGLAFDTVTDANSYVNGLAVNGDVDSSGTAFCLLDSGRVVYFDTTLNSIPLNNFHDIAGVGIHAAHAGFNATNGDILNSYQLTGTTPNFTTEQYVYYSWEDGTDGDVGRRKKSDGSYIDNYLSGLATQSNGTALQKGFPHPMAWGLLEKLIIANGRYLAVHDPTTTTVDYQAFDTKPGSIITSVCRYQNFNAVLSYRGNTNGGVTRGESFLYLWDGLNPSANYFVLKDYKATALYMDGDKLFVFTQGRNFTTKIWRFNGGGFDLVKESGQIGNPPNKGGVDFFWNSLIWGGDSNLLTYTLDHPGGALASYYVYGGLHHVAVVNNTIGMVKNLTQNNLYVGQYSAGGPKTIQYSNINKYALQGAFKSLVYPLPANSTITAIKIYFSQFGAGASCVISLFKDYKPTAIGGANDLLNYTIDTTVTPVGTSYYAIPNGKLPIDKVNAFYLYVQFNHNLVTNTAAIIRKIEIEYQVDTNQI